MNLSFLHKFRGLVFFIILAAMSTLICLAIFGAVQQSYRNGANDPQVEASEEIVNVINKGAPADAIVGNSQPVEIDKSLSPFVTIFDKDGKVVGSSGKLGADSPTPPSGVFDRTKQKNDDIFTWQPQKGVRIAAVLRKADGDKGFVLVGRNLREIERRTEHLIKIVGVAWVGLLVLSALLAWALSKLTPGTNLTLVEENIIVQENSEGSELV
jgi:hypothetical protein